MTEFQSRLHDLDSCIENAKKERLNLMIDKNYEPLNASLLNTLFLNEKLYIASKDLLNVLEDIQISLRSINKLVDDASLKGYEASFKEFLEKNHVTGVIEEEGNCTKLILK